MKERDDRKRLALSDGLINTPHPQYHLSRFLAELAKMPPSVRQPQQMPDGGSSEQELDVSASPGTEEKKEL